MPLKFPDQRHKQSLSAAQWTVPLIWLAVRWQILFMFNQLKMAVNIPWAAVNDLTAITWQSGASAEETSGCMCLPLNAGAKTIYANDEARKIFRMEIFLPKVKIEYL